MKKILILLLCSIFLACQSSKKTVPTFEIKTTILDSLDTTFGYYLSVKPQSGIIEGVLVLLPGLGQSSEDIFQDTKLHEIASKNNILTIGFAARARLAADSIVQAKLNLVLEDVLSKYKVDKDKFVLGGFSAGGGIVLRYAELCKQYPERFPINPQGVFMADAPVDLFHSWKLSQELKNNNFSKVSVEEAEWVEKIYRHYYHSTPSEKPEDFIYLSPFSINKEYGENEIFLKDVAVRAYHDVDINWRLKNRNQTARHANYVATSELINRLMLLGNQEAEFIQTFQTGYRRDGSRHPHSWSIVEEEECLDWIMKVLK